MHRNHPLRAEFEKRFDRFLGIHVHFAAARRIVGADGQQRDFDVEALPNFLEAFEVCAVAAVKD